VTNEIGELIRSSLDNVSFDNTKQNIAAVLLHDVVFDNQRAIHDLVRGDHIGAAAALLRVLFEAHVKAIWVERCATDSEVDMINCDSLKSRVHKRQNMTFQEMIDHIEIQNPALNGSLTKFKTDHWKGLNSLTHSGASQFRNRVKNGEIRKVFSGQLINEIIKFSDRFAIASFVYVSQILKDIDSMKNALALSKEKLNISIEQ